MFYEISANAKQTIKNIQPDTNTGNQVTFPIPFTLGETNGK